MANFHINLQSQQNNLLNKIIKTQMKSIKIQSKLSSLRKKEESGDQLGYGFLLAQSRPNPSLRELLAIALARICMEIELRTPLKLNLQERIKNWKEATKSEEEAAGAVFSEFGNFVIDSIRLLVSENEKWQQMTSSPSKVIKIKSEQRIKYKLLKPGEDQIEIVEDEQGQKQRSEQIIYELRKSNNRLERKVVLLSAEFNKLKKGYESKIEKYKKLLNSSLMQLQMEVDGELNSDYEEMGYHNRVKYGEIVSERRQNMNEQNLRQARSEKHRSSSDYGKNMNNMERMTTQESNRFGTIPTIPILEPQKYQLNRNNYRRV